MTPDENPTAEAVLIELMLDSTSQSGRAAYCGVVSEELTNVASWLGIDSWLGGGDAADTAVSGQTAPARRAGFNAISLVVQFTSELTAGAISEIDAERAYSASALIRQLLECEYLLEVFRLNFDEAAAWYEASDDDLRKNYKVFQVRTVGEFSADEYRTHCERGGHPHPRGAYLLRLQNQIGQLRLPDDDRPIVDRTVDLWLDFAHHLQRIWTLAVDLLSTEHARFAQVRSSSLDRVESAENAWEGSRRVGGPGPPPAPRQHRQSGYGKSGRWLNVEHRLLREIESMRLDLRTPHLSICAQTLRKMCRSGAVLRGRSRCCSDRQSPTIESRQPGRAGACGCGRLLRWEFLRQSGIGRRPLGSRSYPHFA